MKRGEALKWIHSLIEMGPNWPDSCCIFPGSKGKKGYGNIQVNGKVQSTHRVVYSMVFGPIPEGLMVLHRCKQNRACVNPAHLRVGTAKENTEDMIRDGTDSFHNSKLSENDVRFIREYVRDGAIMTRVAEKFNVCSETIENIVHGRTWRHVLP